MINKFTLYHNEVREELYNAKYPVAVTVKSAEDLAKVVLFDHVCAKYKDNHRKNINFIEANCNMFDVDNTHTEESSEWISPNDICTAFPEVEFYVVYSRNHMKIKNGKAARPKFHVYFPDEVFNNGNEYKHFKHCVCEYFTAFDPNAKDSARFFIGVENPKIEHFKGVRNLSEFMNALNINKGGLQIMNNNITDGAIPAGERNSKLFNFAIKVLKQYGDDDVQPKELFVLESQKCEPLLEDMEVNNIWINALKFYRNNILADPHYIKPKRFKYSMSLKPDDYTDIGQARVLVKAYGDLLRYSKATGFMFYTGKLWVENELRAKSINQDLTDRQLSEAREDIFKACDALEEAGNDQQAKSAAIAQKNIADAFFSYVLKRRNNYRLNSTLEQSQPMIELNTDILDSDCFALNTPNGKVDLRTAQVNEHKPTDYCTKITAVSPSNQGVNLFSEFLRLITCNDKSLEDYLQFIAGMSAVGKVFCENLIIAYGGGRNGKSTFFNLLAKVMGDYSGGLSAETLITNSRKNKSPEYAELRGKRLIIAAELTEATRLDTATVKKLCSTDPIVAEKKYKDPFTFVPTHTVVLYTNHLPQVGTIDKGTWRRLIVVPFNAKIEESADIKNYCDYLFEHAGGAVLSWIIEGAKKFIEADYKIELPDCVKSAVEEYRSTNNWIGNYIEERCTIRTDLTQKAGELYKDYRDYCAQMGEFTRSVTDFKAAILESGFKWKKTNAGALFFGLSLSATATLKMPTPKPEFLSDYIPEKPPQVTESDEQMLEF